MRNFLAVLEWVASKRPHPVSPELQLELELPYPEQSQGERQQPKPQAEKPWSLDDYVISYEV